jgi:hypothetical protein
MRRRTRIPTKKLVPTIDSGSKCEHEYRHDGELMLEIDCSVCSGPQDLSNEKCCAGILNILSNGVMPETIVLRRFVHTRYRLHCMGWMRAVAECMASMRRISESKSGASDERCRTCPASSERLAEEITETIRADPRAFYQNPKALSGSLGSAIVSANCSRAPKCVREVMSVVDSHFQGA